MNPGKKELIFYQFRVFDETPKIKEIGRKKIINSFAKFMPSLRGVGSLVDVDFYLSFIFFP